MSDAREQGIAGLEAAMRDLECPVQFSPLLMEARNLLRADTRLIADLLAAAKKLEEAEAFHLACEECEGQEQPEICGHCFPLYDDARVMRRNAIAKAEGAKP